MTPTMIRPYMNPLGVPPLDCAANGAADSSKHVRKAYNLIPLFKACTIYVIFQKITANIIAFTILKQCKLMIFQVIAI